MPDRGLFAKPLHVIVDKRGDPKRYECGGCGNQLDSTASQCYACGVTILGRVGVLIAPGGKAAR